MSHPTLIALLAILTLAAPAFPQQPSSFHVYVGTYTGPKSKGIQLFKFDLASASLTPQGCVAELTHPTFLTIHPNNKSLYAISEVGDYNRQKSGAVAAYSIDPNTGKLTPLNKQPSTAPGPCYVSIDRSGKFALVANYSGGSVAVLPINPDGSLAPPSATIQHKGTGPNKQRQEAPHAHSFNPSPDNQVAFAADLGLDKIFIYRLDPNNGALSPNDPPFASIAPGGGPRHLAVHPNNKFVYVNHEMGNAVSAFAYNPANHSLTELQTLPTLPPDFKGQSATAETVVHPSGKFLYVSNRGHDSIAIFSIDQQTGKLTPQ
ncbi:MAG: lactonase family protein, partial [Planctomycetota bacterium]|nr:lactonase family protein [Planctomycetota bacterium]